MCQERNAYSETVLFKTQNGQSSPHYPVSGLVKTVISGHKSGSGTYFLTTLTEMCNLLISEGNHHFSSLSVKLIMCQGQRVGLHWHVEQCKTVKSRENTHF